MTNTTTMNADQTTEAEVDLDDFLSRKIWDHMQPLRLGGETFEVVGDDDVPGYDEYAILLRRESDGQVFEVDLDVTFRPAKVDQGVTRP